MTESFLLNGWLVETELRRISRPGQSHRLEPKVLQVLVHLAENAGFVVHKEALIDKVWPDVVVHEVALTRCVSVLRQVLGDDPKKPRYIETIPKVGYRLLPPVKPYKPTTPSTSKTPWWPAAAAAVGLLGVLIGL